MSEVHDIKSEVRRYFLVFAALMVLTIITVAISYLKVPTAVAVTLALIVATTKGSLVCLFFMHLISERNFIYILLIHVVIFFIALIYLTVAGFFVIPEGSEYLIPSGQEVTEAHTASKGSHNVH